MIQNTRLDRVISLEKALGSPHDASMPLSFVASMQADEAETIPEGAYRALRNVQLQALFVPQDFGGELKDLDHMVLSLRSVFRRDPAIGLGFGVTSFMAALPVWHSGTVQQKQQLADTLLSGQPVSVAFHEPAHGNDLLANEFEARLQGDCLVLSGRKNIVNNIARAGAATLFVRTGVGLGMREHSLVMLQGKDINRGSLLPRTSTLGARACELRGWQAEKLYLPRDALIGAEGHGFEIVAKVFQVTRAVLPGMAVGIVDTAWRLCHRFLSGRRLYGGRAIDLPLVQRDLAAAFIDLLAADAVSLAAARMAQALPGQLSLASCVSKGLVPQLLSGVMKQLSVMLGARHYVRDGEYGYFQKLLRDLPVVTIGHASADLCIALLVPQLPTLARFSKLTQLHSNSSIRQNIQELESVFRLREAPPPLRLGQITLSTQGRDAVLQGLSAFAAQAEARSDNPAWAHALHLVRTIQERHLALADEILQRMGHESFDHPAWLARARCYAQLFGAACVLNIWRFNRDDALSGGALPFDAEGFDTQLLRAVESLLCINASDPAWVVSVHRSMECCAMNSLSAGVLRLPYAEGSN